MRIRVLALGLVWAASLYGQARRGPARRFNWQDYCFKNSAAPFCAGHDYAIKREPLPKEAPQNAITNPFPPVPRSATSSLIVASGIDWRFVDPLADAVAGFNPSGLAASPLARVLITQLGTSQGMTETDMRKVLDSLLGAEQVALSVREKRIVALITSRGANPTLPALEADWKAVALTGNGMLLGQAEAVEQAVQQIATAAPPAAVTRFAEERQASSDFWVLGPAGMLGPSAVSAGVNRFLLTVSLRDRLTIDAAFEFIGAPDANTLRQWQTTFGAVTLESDVVHVRASMDTDEAQRKFGQIAASPLGERLAGLVKAARYLPARDTTLPKQSRPMIYGLDGGPREINQLPRR